MAQRSHVPQFGNWEGEEDVPYTAYFDKARKGRTGGKIVKANDSQQNSDSDHDNAALTRAPPASKTKAELDEPVGHGPVRRGHERGRSREEGDLEQYVDSPARHYNANRKASGDTTPSRNGCEGPKQATRPRVGSKNSIDKSPLHHARAAGIGNMASPAWEGKNSCDSSHGTTTRSRMRPSTRGDPDEGAAVPKFGDWDENNPASADGYTHIFNKVREERNNGGRVPDMPGQQSPYRTARNRKPANSNAKVCCSGICPMTVVATNLI
ncbi:transaldolase-like [Hibiscus syriacus]|uniref:Transaldolase-like n=1 Tax=Hibiscus syriacus TaxID=106335 RepID=A0A6A3C394_HIBSY|nr:RPM1-interacting protein 4-like isoform X2 [Hibiscus syriacus]XP_039061204.1 RPM1-interacting protein 4-like isoform X2 [Hibiscus syriacus]KAE8673093.1 transaldolase-like [Hibiscus syriacus]KAE8723423.1 transaldolase-like [Hibiscus syriacus]